MRPRSAFTISLAPVEQAMWVEPWGGYLIAWKSITLGGWVKEWQGLEQRQLPLIWLNPATQLTCVRPFGFSILSEEGCQKRSNFGSWQLRRQLQSASVTPLCAPRNSLLELWAYHGHQHVTWWRNYWTQLTHHIYRNYVTLFQLGQLIFLSSYVSPPTPFLIDYKMCCIQPADEAPKTSLFATLCSHDCSIGNFLKKL